MGEDSAKILANICNCPVVQIPGRSFPGVVIQGDSLKNLHRLVEKVSIALSNQGRVAQGRSANGARASRVVFSVHIECDGPRRAKTQAVIVANRTATAALLGDDASFAFRSYICE